MKFRSRLVSEPMSTKHLNVTTDVNDAIGQKKNGQEKSYSKLLIREVTFAVAIYTFNHRPCDGQEH